MSESYELRTLKDVFDKVPTNRIADCLKEIAAGMVVAKTSLEIAKTLAEADGESFPIEAFSFPKVSLWHDDGKGEIGIKLNEVEIGTFVIAPESQIDAP